MKINLTIDDVSFKTEVGRAPKGDDLQKIKVPLEWKNAIKGWDIGAECLLSYREDEKTYMQYKMILIEKQLDQTNPFLLLKPFKESGQRSELRKHKRIKAFIFTIISGEQKVEGEINQGKALNGTISDVSPEGCLLMSEEPFDVNQYINLVINLVDEEPPLKMKCKIMSQRKSHIEKCIFYGLKFEDVEKREQEAIVLLIDGLKN